MNIFVMTWNTHGCCKLPKIPYDADMVFISLQECFTLPKYNHLLSGYSTHFNASLIGLQSILLSKTHLTVQVKKIGMGYLGLPNKGFIAFIINNSILYINAHLIHNDYNQKHRMVQLRKIFTSTYLSHINTIILSGDLNFRIFNGQDQAVEFFKEFPVFKESEISFKPTYKYIKHVLSPSRTPSFCDRILVASKRKVVFDHYNSMENITDSDHKPVYSLFRLCALESNHDLLLVKQRRVVIEEAYACLSQYVWINRRIFLIVLLLTVLCLIIYIHH